MISDRRPRRPANLRLPITDYRSTDHQDLATAATAMRRVLVDHARAKARVVEFHYFRGLTYQETAAALDISPATVDRDLRMARAWLYRVMS